MSAAEEPPDAAGLRLAGLSVDPEALMVFAMAAFLPPNALDRRARWDVGGAMLHASGGSAWFSSLPLTTSTTKPAFRVFYLAIALTLLIATLRSASLYLWHREQLVDLPSGTLVRVNILELRGSAANPALAARPALHAGVAEWGLLHKGCRVTRAYLPPAAAPAGAPAQGQVSEALNSKP